MTPNALTSRILFGLAALIFALGGGLHALAFATKASAAIGASSVAPFMASELKALWLCDSTTLVGLALLFGFLAVRGGGASRAAILLVALIPAGTTAMIYGFLGAFYAAHLLAAATLMVVIAGFMTPPAERVPS
jgi:hypothetical protein